MALRTITPTPQPSLQGVAQVSTGGRVPLGISADRSRVYFGGGDIGSNNLFESTDDGATPTLIATFAAGTNVNGFFETDDGEAVITTLTGGTANSTSSLLWKSSGWSTNRATATWSTKLSTTDPKVYFRSIWGFNAWCKGPNGILFAVQYGPQTSVTGITVWATKVYKSTDHGNTWALNLDLAARYPAPGGSIHCHAIAYDAVWDRWWLTWGDNQADEPGAAAGSGQYWAPILYSDDHGATWVRGVAIPADDYASSPQIRYQSTAIAPMQDCILFGCDSPPYGVNRITRKGYRQMGPIHNASLDYAADVLLTAGGLAMEFPKPAAPGLPQMLAFNQTAGAASDMDVKIMATRDGFDIREVYSAPALSGSGGIVHGPIGPTLTGNVVAANTDGGTANRLTGQLVWED